jgi:zinc finger protein
MAFDCPHCGLHNTEVQAAGEIQPHGVKHMLRVDKVEDLQREVLKSETGSFRIDNLDLEAPPGPGRISNIEGFLSKIREDLEKDQDARKEQAPEQFEAIQSILEKLGKMLDGQEFPIVIIVDDPAGNSKIQPSPLDGTGKYKTTEYKRTPEQNAALGLQPYEGEVETAQISEEDDSDIVEGKTYTLPTNCPGCTKPAAVNMTMINIPHFKQVVISAISCSHCAYRSNEVQTGGEIPELGKRITLEVRGPDDLKRDILKSETCLLKVPECSLELVPGTMGGRFTTVEGLLTQVRNDLHSSIFDVDYGTASEGGDSLPENQKVAWDTFFDKLDKAIKGEFTYTIFLEDPLAGSYVQSYTAPEPDPQIKTEEYQRTADEEDELGLADMRTKQNEDGEYVRE